MRRILCGLLVLLGGLWATDTAWAECRIVSGTPTYTAGTLKDLTCDSSGRLQTGASIGGATGGTANAAAPTLVEGTLYGFFLDLAGNLRVTLGTLLSGEDQTNNAIAVEGATVRSTTMASAVTTDTTSAASILPVGSKSIYGSITAGTQTQKIYGGITSGVTTSTGILLCTLTLTASVLVDACPVITANFLFYIVNTSATTGGASGVVTAMY